jgi:hypothetical protein
MTRYIVGLQADGNILTLSNIWILMPVSVCLLSKFKKKKYSKSLKVTLCSYFHSQVELNLLYISKDW